MRPRRLACRIQGGLGLPECDYYFRTGNAAEKTRKEYIEHIGKMLKVVGESTSEAETDAAAVFQLERALAKISMDITSRREPLNVYHLLPVADLQKLNPTLDWTKLLADVTPQAEERLLVGQRS